MPHKTELNILLPHKTEGTKNSTSRISKFSPLQNTRKKAMKTSQMAVGAPCEKKLGEYSPLVHAWTTRPKDAAIVIMKGLCLALRNIFASRNSVRGAVRHAGEPRMEAFVFLYGEVKP